MIGIKIILFIAFVLLILGCLYVICREEYIGQNRRGRAVLLAGAVTLIVVIVGGVW